MTPTSDHQAFSPLLRLPSEIRIQIYECLIPLRNSRLNISPIELDPVLEQSDSCKPCPHRRRFRLLTDRVRGTSGPATYCWRPVPGQEVLDLHVMGVNRQIHEETCEMLYSNNLFYFGENIECIVPFLLDLTDAGRASLKRIAMTKRSLTNTKDFDRCEWGAACEYLSQNMSIECLDLYVYGVKSRISVNASCTTTSQNSDYVCRHCNCVRDFEAHDELEWARQLRSIKGLKKLQVKANIEECYPPRSGVMDFFLKFSPRIEGDFALWLRTCMTFRPTDVIKIC